MLCVPNPAGKDSAFSKRRYPANIWRTVPARKNLRAESKEVRHPKAEKNHYLAVECGPWLSTWFLKIPDHFQSKAKRDDWKECRRAL